MIEARNGVAYTGEKTTRFTLSKVSFRHLRKANRERRHSNASNVVGAAPIVLFLSRAH
jgi:hypothetical protein